MNSYVRQKVREWLLKITSNRTLFDQQQNDKTHNYPFANEQIEFTTNMDMDTDANSFFNKYNLSQYNITQGNFVAFLEILNISKLNLSKPHPPPKYEIDSCDEYCSSFHDVISGYKSFHGYVSLVVSIGNMIHSSMIVFRIQQKFNLCSGMHIRDNCQHIEYHCTYPERYEQNPNKYDTKMARCG